MTAKDLGLCKVKVFVTELISWLVRLVETTEILISYGHETTAAVILQVTSCSAITYLQCLSQMPMQVPNQTDVQ